MLEEGLGCAHLCGDVCVWFVVFVELRKRFVLVKKCGCGRAREDSVLVRESSESR